MVVRHTIAVVHGRQHQTAMFGSASRGGFISAKFTQPFRAVHKGTRTLPEIVSLIDDHQVHIICRGGLPTWRDQPAIPMTPPLQSHVPRRNLLRATYTGRIQM